MPPPLIPDLSGQAIADGRLKLLELLGSGAFGVVYKAKDIESNPSSPDYYAIKCLPHYPEGSTKSDRQLRELVVQRRCAHPTIIAIHRVYVEGAYVFVVLDYCAGGDLFQAINNNGHRFRNNDLLVKALFVNILDAVEHCHQLGFAHRDLKPENILLNKELSKAWLGDFGLACSAKLSTNYGCGSRPYMSPECFNKRTPNLKGYSVLESDIWSLGVILVNIISGHPPWLAPCPIEDEFFKLYLRNPSQFLRRQLRISYPAIHILNRIFHFDPRLRPSISLLRKQVLTINTFFLRPGEDVSAPDPFAPRTPPRSFRKLVKDVFKAFPRSPKSSNLSGLPNSPSGSERLRLEILEAQENVDGLLLDPPKLMKASVFRSRVKKCEETRN